AGVFSLIQGGDRRVGEALVTHPLIKAVGFTGSLRGGRALFDLCSARPEPIPFFGELGSVNPMFVLPTALANRTGEIAKGWAASLSMGAGQFCTNPGIAVVMAGSAADRFAALATDALAAIAPQTMLTQGIADAYRDGNARFSGAGGVEALHQADNSPRMAAPQLYRTTAKIMLENHELAEEVFGPLGIIVTVADEDELVALRSEEHTSELQSRENLVCRLLL